MDKKKYSCIKTFTILGMVMCMTEGLRFLGAFLYGYALKWADQGEAGVFRLLSLLFHSGWTDTLVQYVFMLGIPYLLAFFLISRMPAPPAVKRRMPPELFAGGLVIALGMGYLLNFAASIVQTAISLATGKSLLEMNPLQDMMSTLTPSVVIYACLLGPFMEEVLFRGFLFSRARRFGDRTAVLFTAVMFGLMHGNLSQFLYATAIGLVLGYTAARTGRLRECVLLHIMVNSYSTVLLLGQNLIMDAGLEPLLAGYGLAVLAFVILIVASAAVLLVRLGPLVYRQLTAAEGPKEPWKKFVWLNPGFLLYGLICTGQMLFYLLY